MSTPGLVQHPGWLAVRQAHDLLELQHQAMPVSPASERLALS